MATIASPRRRFPRLGRWQLAGIGAVAVAAVVGALAMGAGGSTAATGPLPGWELAPVSSGTIDATVSATGSVEPQARAELRFSAADGVVSEVLVAPGDAVEAGQPLARIDPAGAELALARAQADLAQAQASYQEVAGGASAEELKEAQARVAEATGRYQQAEAQVTGADIAAARAKLEQAQARLAQLQGGPKDTERRDAEAQLQRAQTTLQSQRDSLSAAKTGAELELQRSVAELAGAQSAYATAKQNWEFVRQTNQDPSNPEITDAQGKEVKNKLNETQRQQYYDTFVAAESRLRQAEVAVQKAQVSYDAARQSEETGVRDAEQQLAIAQAAYDTTMAGADRDQLAEARAAVAQAQAELARLSGGDRAGDLAAAQAAVDIAQAGLDKLTAGADEQALAKAQADVMRSEVAVKEAERTLAQTTLSAPFAATVARVDLRVGEQAGQDAVVAVVDLSSFHIDVPVDELDVAQVRAGQPATVALDALLDQELTGTVTTIEPLATESDKGTNTYQVTVRLDGAGAQVLPGMSATVQIVTQRKEGAVLAPRRAVQSEDGQSFVYVPAAPGEQLPPGQPGVRRPVTLGLSNSQSVEITGGLKAGEQVLVPDVVQTVNVNVRGG